MARSSMVLTNLHLARNSLGHIPKSHPFPPYYAGGKFKVRRGRVLDSPVQAPFSNAWMTLVAEYLAFKFETLSQGSLSVNGPLVTCAKLPSTSPGQYGSCIRA